MVVGAGAVAYKLGKSQTKQVEEASGMSIEEMTDEEIQKYVQENNIQTEPLDENDQAAIAEAGDDDSDDNADDEPDYMDELEKLADLHDKGIITDEEFEAKKKQILDL